jgi:hypothetical protein
MNAAQQGLMPRQIKFLRLPTRKKSSDMLALFGDDHLVAFQSRLERSCVEAEADADR